MPTLPGVIVDYHSHIVVRDCRSVSLLLARRLMRRKSVRIYRAVLRTELLYTLRNLAGVYAIIITHVINEENKWGHVTANGNGNTILS